MNPTSSDGLELPNFIESETCYGLVASRIHGATRLLESLEGSRRK